MGGACTLSTVTLRRSLSFDGETLGTKSKQVKNTLLQKKSALVFVFAALILSLTHTHFH